MLECQTSRLATLEAKRVFQVAKCQVHLKIPLRLKLGLRKEVIATLLTNTHADTEPILSKYM